MGQFQSKEYDGDPYVDLMRALPERELIWWVQKAIWLVEGFTFLDHFGRTYPGLFVHKCRHCNGAGSVTCPHCHGYKLRQGSGPGAVRLSEMSAESARALVQSGRGGGAAECGHCGAYCDWDHESEWEEKWSSWESKLAYYDRTYGELMNEWYEDVLHEGNLDEDTPHEEGPPPGPQETGPLAEYDRRKKRTPELMAALMARYGGHPYDTLDLLPYNVVDPIKRTPLENLWAMGHNRNELPPELHPYNFPELLLLPVSPLTEHDHQVRMEALICRNLDAALRDERKPYMFEPTAGTVPCPACYGTPYSASLLPNVGAMFRLEPPTWARVLSRMSAFATRPREMAAAADRHYLEYPQQDAAVGELQDTLVAQLEGPPGREAARGARRRAVLKGARAGLVGGVDRPDDPTYLDSWGVRGLSADRQPGSSEEEQPRLRIASGVHRQPEGGPLARNAWMNSSSSSATPAAASAFIRDVTRLRQAQGTAAEQDVVAQLQQRYSPAAVQAMLDGGGRGSSSSRGSGVGASSSSSSSSSSRAISNSSNSRGAVVETAVVAAAPGQR